MIVNDFVYWNAITIVSHNFSRLITKTIRNMLNMRGVLIAFFATHKSVEKNQLMRF